MQDGELIEVATLSNGLSVWKKQDAVGGWDYYGETCGIIARLYNSSCGSREEFEAIYQDLYGTTPKTK